MSMRDNLDILTKIKSDIDFQRSTTPEFVELTLDSEQAKILSEYLNYMVLSNCTTLSTEDPCFAFPDTTNQLYDFTKHFIAMNIGEELKNKNCISFTISDDKHRMTKKFEGCVVLPGLFTSTKEDKNEQSV